MMAELDVCRGTVARRSVTVRAAAPARCAPVWVQHDPRRLFRLRHLSLGELIGGDFAAWPNVDAWYKRMQALPNWQSANAALYIYAPGSAEAVLLSPGRG